VPAAAGIVSRTWTTLVTGVSLASTVNTIGAVAALAVPFEMSARQADAVRKAAPPNSDGVRDDVMNRKFGVFRPGYFGFEPNAIGRGALVARRSCVISSREMSLHEIVLPETKPETEWVLGRAVQKVSPTYWQAALQTVFAAALREWAEAGEFGRVGTEWRFRVAPPGAVVRPLVPDVAFLSFAALPRNAAPEIFQVPLGAPTVAIEILSEDDRPHDVADKIATYLASGSAAVVIVDPQRVEIDVHDSSGMRTLVRGDVFAHPALPDFQLDLATFFDRALR